jgi:hypothetical protein
VFTKSRAVKIVLSTVAASGLVLATAGAASAYSPQVRRACAGDYHRLCPGYKLHSNQLRACMEAAGFSISGGCIDALISSGELSGSRAKRR